MALRVLFLLTTINSKVHAHHATGFLSSLLRHNGHEVDYVELSSVNYSRLGERIEDFKPHLLAASSVMQQMPYVAKLVNFVKQTYPNIKIILGGIHPILSPDSIRDISGLDALCTGEGEKPLLEYANALECGGDPCKVPNLRLRVNDDIFDTPRTFAVTEKDLAEFPLQDRTIFPQFRRADKSQPLPFRPRVLWGRGCPYACSYCAVPSLRRALKEPMAAAGAKWVRYPPVDRCIEELDQMSDRWNFSTFVIDDDVLTTRKDWIMSLATKYPDRLRSKLQFEANLRIESIDQEMMAALKDMGCCLLKFGLENGDYDIRKSILRRPIPDERIIEVFNWAHQLGIPAHTFNMVGVPGESKSSIWKTIGLNRKIRPERVQITIFYPYLGVPLGEQARSAAPFFQDSDSYFAGKASVATQQLSASDIEFFARWFKFLVYVGYAPATAWPALISAIKGERDKWIRAPLLQIRNFIRAGLSSDSARSHLPPSAGPEQADIEDMNENPSA